MDTTQAQVEWMDMETTNADMHARAGDAELILRTTQRQSAVMMVVCSRICYGLLATSQADSWLLFGAAATAGAADSSTPVGASSLSLLWSSVQHVRLWRVRLLGCASWKQFSRLQKTFLLL